MASALEDYFDPNSPDYITRALNTIWNAHNAYQDWLDPRGRQWRKEAPPPLPPQDEVIKGERPPPYGYSEYRPPTTPPAGDTLLTPDRDPRVVAPYIPRPSTSPDTRDYDEYRARRGDQEFYYNPPANPADALLVPDPREPKRQTGGPMTNIGWSVPPRYDLDRAAPALAEPDSFVDRLRRNIPGVPGADPGIMVPPEGYPQKGVQQIAARTTAGDPWLAQNAPFPTRVNPEGTPVNWVSGVKRPFGQDPGDALPGRAPPTATAYLAPPKPPRAVENAPATLVQTPSATAADRAQEITAATERRPAANYEAVVNQFPVIQTQQLTAVPGNRLEYWSPGEPGTPDRPRPPSIPINEAGMELGPDSTPLDILGDVVSHHMVKKDPVIKKYYEGFVSSLTSEQKEHLQAQYYYYTKNEGETRPYKDWEKTAGLPAYFRGYAFSQWPDEFNQQAYTPQQRQHFDRMMNYLRTAPSALKSSR